MVCTCAGPNRTQSRVDLFGIHILQCPNFGTPTRVELHDPQVQSDKIKSVMRYWTGLLSAVINKAASRAILAVAANLVDKVNSTPPTASSSDQGDDIMDANQENAQRFMEDMELSVLNQDHIQSNLRNEG